MHEAAHWFMAALLGVKLKFVLFFGLSLEAHYNCHGLKESVVALAGPLANLLLASFFTFCLPSSSAFVYEANLLVALVNLLPILPLDGGRILRGIFSKYISWLKLTKILSSIGEFVACIIACTAIYWAKNGAFWWLVFAAYIFYLSYKEKAKAPYVLIQALILGNNRGFGERYFRLPSRTNLREAIYYMSPGWHNTVRVNGKNIEGRILISNWLRY